MNLKKLEKLNDLRKNGALTEEEFQQEKQKLMNNDTNSSASGDIPFNLTENTYLGLMNLIVLVPYIGWIASIIAWAVGKDKSEKIDKQGKNILNWMISYVIYAIGISFILMFIAIISGAGMMGMSGFGMGAMGMFGAFGAVGILGLSEIALLVILLIAILPIIGGIKGFNGNTFRYPLTISFIK